MLLASIEKEISMLQKKKRKSLSFTPPGTPGAGPGWHRSASSRGSGRLGSALKRSRKSEPTTPIKDEKPKARVMAKREDEGAEIDESSLKKPLKKPASKGTTKSEGTSRPTKKTTKDVKSGPPPLTQSPVGSDKQKRAQTVAKDARKKEAGLEGRRIGKASASGKRVQARRDSKQ